MKFRLEEIVKSIGIICLILMLASVVGAQEEKEADPAAGIPLAGKVSSQIKRSVVAEVAGKKRDFRRLIKDDAQHDALMRKFAEPMTEEERQALHSKQLARYGSQRIERRVQLSDFGSDLAESRKKHVSRSAAEPEEEESSLAAYAIMSIIAASAYVLYRNR